MEAFEKQVRAVLAEAIEKESQAGGYRVAITGVDADSRSVGISIEISQPIEYISVSFNIESGAVEIPPDEQRAKALALVMLDVTLDPYELREV